MTTTERLANSELLAHPISAAVLLTLHQRGYPEATVDEFLERAGISRAEFDRHFDGKQDVTQQILEAHLEVFAERVGRAYAGGGAWPDNLRAAAQETARYGIANPDLTWYVMVGIAEADLVTRAGRDRLFHWGARMIDGGRAVAADPAKVPDSAPLIAIGAAVEAIRRRQDEGRPIDVAGDLPWLMYAAVRPYLGEEAARREFEIEVPADLRSS